MTINCPGCGKPLLVPDASMRVGNPKITCPVCNTGFKAKPEQPKVKSPSNDPTTEWEKEKKYAGNEPGWLIVHDEQTRQQTFPLKVGKQLVGRKSQSKPCDIMIETPDMYMGRNHFFVEVKNLPNNVYQYLLYNNGKQANPTFLDTLDILENVHYLKDGDTVQAGMTKIVFRTSALAQNQKDAAQQVKQSDYPPTVQLKK